MLDILNPATLRHTQFRVRVFFGPMSFSLDIDSLPTLPIIVQQLMGEMNNPNSSIKDIAGLIEHDQSMSSKILKLVNSSFYGFSKRIGTIGHATSILGFETVKSLVLGVSVMDTFKIREFNMLAFWEHSIQTASLSAFLAKKLRYPQQDEAFTVGLIHDVGKLIFMLQSPAAYRRIQAEVALNSTSELQLERRYLKMDHAFAGAQVARLWNFPQAYIHAIDGHHNRSSLNDQPASLRQILYLSNLFSHLHTGDTDEAIDINIFTQLNLNFEEMQNYLVSIDSEIKEFLKTLSH
jgi:two-component system, cell cycle response regulator